MRTFWCRPASIAAVTVIILLLTPTISLASTPDPSTALSATTWPGDSAVTIADGANVFGMNLSGLSFESAGVLWAVQNSPSKLYRLVPQGTGWSPDPASGWASGKPLRYATGSGNPDAEAVVVTPDGLFVATEHDNNGAASLPKILRFDASATASSLNANAEWNLSADLPSLPANAGPEGIAWIPDTYLIAHGFHDERTGAAYTPTTYPDHGSGLFFVGVETGGTVYAYVLTRSGGAYTRIATIPSGFTGVMDLEYEPATGHLWAACDDICQGRASTLDLNAQGRFTVTQTYDRPAGMANYNNEGFAIAPQTACIGGHKPVVWSDDTNDAGHALRAGTINCTP